MRELIIRCDHCGKIIEGNPYKVCLEQIDRETDDYSIEQTEDQKKVREMDWCENCFRNLTAFLLDTSHKLLVAPNVIRKEENVIKESEIAIKEPENESEQPVPSSDASGGGTKEKSKNRYWKAKSII